MTDEEKISLFAVDEIGQKTAICSSKFSRFLTWKKRFPSSLRICRSDPWFKHKIFLKTELLSKDFFVNTNYETVNMEGDVLVFEPRKKSLEPYFIIFSDGFFLSNWKSSGRETEIETQALNTGSYLSYKGKIMYQIKNFSLKIIVENTTLFTAEIFYRSPVIPFLKKFDCLRDARKERRALKKIKEEIERLANRELTDYQSFLAGNYERMLDETIKFDLDVLENLALVQTPSFELLFGLTFSSIFTGDNYLDWKDVCCLGAILAVYENYWEVKNFWRQKMCVETLPLFKDLSFSEEEIVNVSSEETAEQIFRVEYFQHKKIDAELLQFLDNHFPRLESTDVLKNKIAGNDESRFWAWFYCCAFYHYNRAPLIYELRFLTFLFHELVVAQYFETDFVTNTFLWRFLKQSIFLEEYKPPRSTLKGGTFRDQFLSFLKYFCPRYGDFFSEYRKEWIYNKFATRNFEASAFFFTTLKSLDWKEKMRKKTTAAKFLEEARGFYLHRDSPEEVEESKVTCQVCRDKKAQYCFRSCFHLSMCEECKRKLTQCPLCRSEGEITKIFY